jgi:hypothetical protein
MPMWELYFCGLISEHIVVGRGVVPIGIRSIFRSLIFDSQSWNVWTRFFFKSELLNISYINFYQNDTKNCITNIRFQSDKIWLIKYLIYRSAKKEIEGRTRNFP